MTTYYIESKTALCGWSPEGDGETYATLDEAEKACRWLERNQPTNDDGAAIEYQVAELE